MTKIFFLLLSYCKRKIIFYFLQLEIMVSISCRVTTDRPDLEQERSNPLRCKGCLDESKPSRQEQSVQSIQPDGLPLVTNRGISLLQKNVQPAVSHHLQNKLKTKHLSWKS